jgi:hypothetical protein
MTTNESEARDRAETTEEITKTALELCLVSVLGYNKTFTKEQQERSAELDARCREWMERGYILAGKQKPTD